MNDVGITGILILPVFFLFGDHQSRFFYDVDAKTGKNSQSQSLSILLTIPPVNIRRFIVSKCRNQ